MRNIYWTWGDGGDMYVGCSEWELWTTQTLGGGVGSLSVTQNASLTLNSGTFQIGIHGGTGTADFNTTSSIYSNGGFNVGTYTFVNALSVVHPSVGIVTIEGNTTVSTDQPLVGGWGGMGTVTMSGNATYNAGAPLQPSLRRLGQRRRPVEYARQLVLPHRRCMSASMTAPPRSAPSAT